MNSIFVCSLGEFVMILIQGDYLLATGLGLNVSGAGLILSLLLDDPLTKSILFEDLLGSSR